MDVVAVTPSPQPVSRRFALGLTIALGVVIAAGVGFSLALTHERPLWLDEVLWIQESVDSPYAQLILHYRSQDPNHPPLSFLLMKVSIDLAGSDAPWVVRLIPLLAGLACIPLAYLVGRQCHSRLLGLCGAAAAACNPLLVDQSAQAKVFSLIGLFALLSLLGTVVLVRGRVQNVRHAAWLGLALGVGLWNSQLALVSWGAAAITLGAVVAVDRAASRGLFRRQVLTALTAGGVAALVGLPGILDLFGVRVRPGPASSGAGFAEIVQEIRYSLPVPLPPPWRWAGLAVALAGLFWLARRRGLVAVPLIALAAFSLLFAYALRQRHPFFTERYLMPLLPSLWFGLGAYVVLPRRPDVRVAAALGLLLVMAVELFTDGVRLRGWRSDYEYGMTALVRSLGREMQPGDRLIFSPAYTEALGRYANLPVAGEAPAAPCERGAGDDAEPGSGVWLVAVRVISWEEAEEARKDANCLAKRYGRELDGAWLAAHVSPGQSAAVRIGPEGVSYYAATGGSWVRRADRE
jgi:hypothetical protein